MSTLNSSVFSATTEPAAASAPAYFTGQTERTWQAIAGSGSRIEDVLPSPIAGGNPVNIVVAWNSGTIDQNGVYRIYGGGHNDYYGNEVYALDLFAASPAYVLETLPTSGALAGGSTGSILNGSWGDDSPRVPHTYDMLSYVPGFGMFAAGSPAVSHPDGYSGNGIWKYTAEAGTPAWERISGVAPGTIGNDGSIPGGQFLLEEFSLGVSDYDSVTGLIWAAGAGSTILYSIDPATEAVATYSATWAPRLDGTCCISPSKRVGVWYSSRSFPDMRVLDIDNQVVRGVSFSGSMPANAPGIAWHEASQAFLCWGGGATLYKLTATDWINGPYTVTTVSNTGGGATPTAQTNEGTFKRLRLVPNLGGAGIDGLVVVNAINQSTYIYKLPAGGV